MENPEEVLQSLDEFAKLKPKDIPRELEEYLCYVAKTGDPVYQWSLVKCLFREKLLNVITDFYESCPTIDLPPCPNVDPFNYETMKRNLLERLDSFVNAPFTVQRLCELLTTPRKEYSRVDKFMRAIEKNILVVSTREPGNARRSDIMQPDFLMNGVMDGRSIDISDAIETVSSDGVNLMHGDDAEVNIGDSESARIDCAGADEIDMDDQPDVETPTDVWEKDRDSSASGDDESAKGYDGNEESDAENEPKINPEVDHLKDIESESKEPDSPDLETEGFGDPAESEQHIVDDVDSTTTGSDGAETLEETSSISEVCNESKPDDVAEKLIPEIECGPADSLSEISTSSDKDEPSEDNALKAKPPDDDIISPNLEVIVEEKSPSEQCVTSAEESRDSETDLRKDEDSVTVQNPEVGESGDDVEDVSPLESLEEVTSNIVPSLVSETEVSAVDSPQCEEVVEESVPEVDEKGESEIVGENEVSPSEDSELQERMDVDEINQATDVQDEPMDESEQLPSES